MPDAGFTGTFGTIALLLGLVFLVVSTNGIWDWFDKFSMQANPMRRAVNRKFPRFDLMSMRFGRWFLRIVGALATILGIALLYAVSGLDS